MIKTVNISKLLLHIIKSWATHVAGHLRYNKCICVASDQTNWVKQGPRITFDGARMDGNHIYMVTGHTIEHIFAWKPENKRIVACSVGSQCLMRPL